MTARQNTHQDAAELARLWLSRQCQDPARALYVYHAPGQLDIGTEPPPGMELADGRRIMPNWTQQEARNHIQMVLRYTPYLTERRPA
uniref:Uncharacterized protein n=1 Tax=viral metagenome TaxID=1070528 RepID=A0A6M3JNJ4_9ZZZZ